MKNKLTITRLVVAVISTGLEEAAIWAIWRWALHDFGIELPFIFLITIMAVWAAFSIWLFIFTTRSLNRQATVGLPLMVGAKGKAVAVLNPEGQVKIMGELWGAVAEEGKIETGTEIVVVGQDGLKLSVRKIDGAGAKR